MQAQKIGVIGCGWLGTALAKELISQEYQVLGSTTQKIKLKALKASNVEAIVLEFDPSGIQGPLDPFLDCTALVIGIPPKLRKKSPAEYLKIVSVLSEGLKSYTGQLIFLSSTAVYSGKEGLCLAQELFRAENQRAESLLEAETQIRHSFPQALILRLGGLMGPQRHPIRQLEGKTLLNPESRINFIHQKDAVAAIIYSIKHSVSASVYNLVCPDHPKRGEYYPKMADRFGFKSPSFGDQIENIRIVDHSAFCLDTGFEYQITDLFRLD